MNPSQEPSTMDLTKLVTRVVMLPLDAAAFGAEILAQSTKSVQKLAEKSVESLVGGIGDKDVARVERGEVRGVEVRGVEVRGVEVRQK